MSRPFYLELDLAPGDPIPIVERPATMDGTVLLQGAANYDEADLFVFDLDHGYSSVPVYQELGLTAVNAGLLVATLPPDGYWDRDGVGYSLRRLIMPAVFVPESLHRYKVELKLKTTNLGIVTVERLVRMAAVVEPV